MFEQDFYAILESIEQGEKISDDLIECIKTIKLSGNFDSHISRLIRQACKYENLLALDILLYDGSESPEIFLQLGANINTIYIYDKNLEHKDSYLIHYLAAEGKNKALASLLNYMPNPFVLDSQGNTILLSAIRGKNVGGIKIILDKFPTLAHWTTSPCNLFKQQTYSGLELIKLLAKRARPSEKNLYAEMEKHLKRYSSQEKTQLKINQSSETINDEQKNSTLSKKRKKTEIPTSLLIHCSQFKRAVTTSNTVGGAVEDKISKPEIKSKRPLIVVKKMKNGV